MSSEGGLKFCGLLTVGNLLRVVFLRDGDRLEEEVLIGHVNSEGGVCDDCAYLDFHDVEEVELIRNVLESPTGGYVVSPCNWSTAPCKDGKTIECNVPAFEMVSIEPLPLPVSAAAILDAPEPDVAKFEHHPSPPESQSEGSE